MKRANNTGFIRYGSAMPKFKENSVREAWILCLILGVIMLNFPFIHIFNVDQTIFGIPQIIVYFFCGWPLSILVIWFFAFRTQWHDDQEPPDESRDEL